MASNWKEYQEEAAEFFRSLGLDAETDVTIQGARTKHDIDVLVKSHHIGFEFTWIVECKYWKKPVSKLHVLGLREIVSDTGADRGILLSESGFQSGAIEAANLTNVQVTSLAKATESAQQDISAMRMRELFDRTEICHERYWEIPKGIRIDYDLRPGFAEGTYSGNQVIDFCRETLSRAFRGLFPIEVYSWVTGEEVFNSPREVIERVEQMISELECKLDTCEAAYKNK